MINYTTTPFSDKMSEDDTIPLDESDTESPNLSQNTGYESCSSSSGDEDSERCSICLLRLKLQPLGRPENCKHLFCLECITQWAKVCVILLETLKDLFYRVSPFQLTPSCPIDRVDFSRIFHRDQLSCGETGHRDVVKVKPVQDVEDVPEETLCEVCQRGDREHILLLCDSCDLAYHTTCLAPPLDRVPRGSWYCDLCVRVNPVRPDTRRVREDVITRTGHLERIRGAVTAARRELETRFAAFLGNNRPVRTRTRKRIKRTKRKVKSKPKRKRKCQSKRSPVKVDKAIIDNVRRALGISDTVYNERPVPLQLFGNYNELDPVDDEEEEEETLVGPMASVGPGTRVMPRHVAIERVNLARRRRNKMGLEITEPGTGSVDVLSSIISCQTDLFTQKSTIVTSPKKLNLTKASLKCKSAAINSTTEEQTNNADQSSVSQAASESPIRSESNIPTSENSNGNSTQTGQEETRDNSSPLEDLPPLSAEGLRTLASKSASEGKDSPDKSGNSDECDKVKSPKSESSPSSAKSPRKSNGESHTPKKKSIIKDIFGSDEEAETNEADKTNVSDNKENADNFSDVSDKEIEAAEEVHRELSVSSINSDQSESFEKAATLEGLNPEAISAEEDFTSLSEEEEGEIKTIQRKKELRLKKKELQKKVKELEKQVIDMSPNSAPIDLNGLLEDGEINDDKKKKSAQSKDKGKLKKKKIKGKAGLTVKEDKTKGTSDENGEKNQNASGRNYRKKKSVDAEDQDDTHVVKSKTKKSKDKVGKKPELQRYDVRRVLDAKKDKPVSRKSAENDNSKENNPKGKDEFGRDISNKDQSKKRKGGRSRSRSRGRKKRRRSRKRSSSSSSSSSLSLSSSSSSSGSSSSSSSSRSRSRNRKSKLRKGNKKKIVIKKKLPLAEKIKNRVRSEDKSKNKKKSKRSISRSRSRSPKKDKTKSRRKPTRSRSRSRRNDKSKDKSRNRKRLLSRSRSRSVKKKSKNVSEKKKDKPKTKAAKVPEPTDKSVYSSGDKIMISVNFPSNSEHVSAKDRLDKEKVTQTKSDQKPSVIIDLLDDEKPYKVIETEKVCVDIASDTEKENTQPQSAPAPSKGPMTPPESDRYDPFDPTVSPDNQPESLPVDPPLTPPLQPSTPPAESPTPTKMTSPPNSNTSPGIQLSSTPQKTPASGKKR